MAALTVLAFESATLGVKALVFLPYTYDVVSGAAEADAGSWQVTFTPETSA